MNARQRHSRGTPCSSTRAAFQALRLHDGGVDEPGGHATSIRVQMTRRSFAEPRPGSQPESAPRAPAALSWHLRARRGFRSAPLFTWLRIAVLGQPRTAQQ